MVVGSVEGGSLGFSCLGPLEGQVGIALVLLLVPVGSETETRHQDIFVQYG